MNLINKYDLLFLCETWLKDSNVFDIEGFVNITFVNRNVNIGTRCEGGIAVFCRQFLLNAITVEKVYNEGIVVLKLNHTFFDIEKDIFICFSYIPHEKSNFYQLCEIDFHETICSIVLEYSDKGNIFVCGDLNSRIGEVNDFLDYDELDKYISNAEHVENPNIPNRVSMDKTVNGFGRKLLQLCYDTGLVVANGRLGNDKSGNFTFCTTRGRSVNDYLLFSPIDIDKISEFDVLNLNEFSDHSPIFF